MSGLNRRTVSGRQIGWAAALQMMQAILMELTPFVGLFVLLLLGIDVSALPGGFSFVVPFFQENLPLMMVMSGIFGTLRLLGAIGLLRNRMWGYALSMLTCTVTLVLMPFMLPAGILDGVLTGAAVVLLLFARYGRTEIPTATE